MILQVGPSSRPFNLGPDFKQVDLGALAWVDISGKLTTTAAASGGFTQDGGGAAYSPETRDAPFGYVDLAAAVGAGNEVWDYYTGVDIVLASGKPTGSGVVGCFAMVLAAASMAAEPGMVAGVEWDTGRLQAKAMAAPLGAAPSTGADNGTTPGPVIAGFEFASLGLNLVGARHGAVSQTSYRSFQNMSKTDKLRIALGFYNEGTVESVWAGVSLWARLNRR